MNNQIQNNIEYSDYFVAFLDVLGFKKLVFSGKKSDHKKIEEYFDLIESVTGKLKRIKAKKHLGSLIISDSVILSVPFESGPLNKIDKLRHLCVAVGKIQLTLAIKNIWVRGAISSGPAFFDPRKNNVVGKAYINAYQLEERQAVYPRVIIDNKIIAELQKQTSQDLIDEINFRNQGGPPFINWNTDILFNWEEKREIDNTIGQDAALFIDFFSPTLLDNKKLRLIINNLEKSMYSENNVYPKFRWLVDYLLVCCKFKLSHVSGNENKTLMNIVKKLNRL
jgi:hypothetical protein